VAVVMSGIIACACCRESSVIIPQPQRVEMGKGWCRADAVPQIDTLVGEIPAEGYEMEISRKGIRIKAGDDAGAFYALQSLEQLKNAYGRRIPAQTITDAPRFPYRGVHLDVSRHFRNKAFVKKQLLMLAKLKINRFHFHLVDGGGWRIEIKSHPELMETSAWRPQSNYMDWWNGKRIYCTPDYPGCYGGFFTQEELREIVAFADSLHIVVIPEIEMFGHSEEVTAVFPALACGYKTKSGNGDGTINSPQPDLCIGKDATFRFLEDVLTEVMDIFPSEYIHIGGDEADKESWRTCPDCKARMKSEGLEDVDELQSYGIARIESFLNAHGRQIIGWDEILEGGLAPNATVMSWRGEEGGREAAAAGHHVVMTPGAYCYLDKCQNDPANEPASFGGYLPVDKIYGYDPAPADMEGREYVSGVQTNLWTELVRTDEHAEYMYYPRVFALAEIAWTQPENKDLQSFRTRAIALGDRARKEGYNVFDLTKEKMFRDGYDEEIKHKARGCKVTYDTAYHSSYQADGDGSLVDGRIGGWDFRDRWQGWLNCDAMFTVDLGTVKTIHKLGACFGQWKTAQIMMPAAVRFEISEDGEEYQPLSTVERDIDWNESRPQFNTFEWSGSIKTRYIRVTGCINENHWGWIFADEFRVR